MANLAQPVIVANSPFSEGVLPEELQAEVVKIRQTLLNWLAAIRQVRAGAADAQPNLDTATQALLAHQVPPQYAFASPPPGKPFRATLLSMIRCYFIALTSSLSTEELSELAARLKLVPPYGERIPVMDGPRMTANPGDLSDREYEGLMRTMQMVIIGMVDNDVAKSWRELGEVGVQTWEEV